MGRIRRYLSVEGNPQSMTFRTRDEAQNRALQLGDLLRATNAHMS